MPCQIINLDQWKSSHPPMLRLWVAHNQAVAAWWEAYWNLWFKMGKPCS